MWYKIGVIFLEPIYFTKVEFMEAIGYVNHTSTILLNLPMKELSYQVFRYKRRMPAISGDTTIHDDNHEYSYSFGVPAKVIKSGKNNFEKQVIEDDAWEQDVEYSYGIKLTDEQMEQLLPYCNALDFEPFRGKKMSMDDAGYIGYRDEVSVRFKAITDSYIPEIELPMYYYYDEEHIWPSERLYRYLIKTYFENNSKIKAHKPVYGGFSLFF